MILMLFVRRKYGNVTNFYYYILANSLTKVKKTKHAAHAH